MIYQVNTGGIPSIKKELVALFRKHIRKDIFWPESCDEACKYIYLHFRINKYKYGDNDITHSMDEITRYTNVSIGQIKEIIINNSNIPKETKREFSPIKFNLTKDYEILITKDKVKFEGMAINHNKILELAEVIKNINK